MSKRWILSVCLLTLVLPFSLEGEEIYIENIYLRDWYSPPPDWRAGVPISQYNLNTRIPELVWIPYEGAYAMGLRIRSIDKTMLERQIEAKLIKANPQILEFDSAREKETRFRNVSISRLNIDAGNMTGVSFKMKASGNIKFNTGLGVIDTADPKFEDKNVKCSDGFKAYRLNVKPAGRRLNGLTITVDEADKLADMGEYIIFDLVYHYAEKQPYVKDIPPRKWAVEDGTKDIGEVYAYMNSDPKDKDVEIIDIPLKNWVPRDPEKDKNVKVEYITEKIDGKDVPAVRFTVEKGERAYWICPVKIDATQFNTMSFIYKIEVPEGLKVTGEQRPPDWGWAAYQYHEYFDNFGVSYLSATRDVTDWSAYGVTRAGSAFMRQKNAAAPAGWNVFAWDNLHDDMTGNKDFSREAVTHWTFYYGSKKLSEGQKIVVTIANPKVASGIMRTGGDMGKYKEFKKEFAKLKYDFSDSSKYLNASEKGRLPEPLPIMKDGIFNGEIIITGWTSQPEIRSKAADELKYLITLVCSPVTDIPILNVPSTEDNVKIFLGTGSFQRKFLSPDQLKSLQEDSKKLEGSHGCAIRTFGKNIFIFGGNFQFRPNNGDFPGSERGTLNGVYLFMENNTNMIMSAFDSRGLKNMPKGRNFVFSRPENGDWDIVWGDFLHRPRIESYSVHGASPEYISRNFGNINNWFHDAKEMKFGFRRHKSVNHWFGFGAGVKKADGSWDYKTPNEKWGLGTDGKRMIPGCYTGHPCLINVLEDAKEDYVTCVFEKSRDFPTKDVRLWEITDKIALWLEDTHKVCVCPNCTAPFRLPNGELVKYDETDFLSTQFFAQTNAMIQAYNVYVQPGQYVEPIIYFWEFSIPRGPLSRMIRPKVCPYVRKNYKEPIYAPVNDAFWRNYVRWSQLTGSGLAQYEYFLGVNFRPWCDINKYDLAAELDLGVIDYVYEGEAKIASLMERWVLQRQGWDPEADPMELRKYYIRRTFREAAPDMEKFYFKLQKNYYDDPTLVEFEETEGRMAQWAMWTKSGSKTLAEELIGHLDDAMKNVKTPLAKFYVETVRDEWLRYLEGARTEKTKANLK